MTMMTTGCFATQPLIEVPVNQAPTIEHSSPARDEVLVFDIEQTVVFVIVEDDGGPDQLEYRWTIDGLWEQGTAEPIISENSYGSRLTLTRDSIYDGRHLRCRVYDRQGSSDELSWLIDIPEEER